MADVAQHEIELVRVALGHRAFVLHFEQVALLAEAGQHQAVDIQVGDLPQHRHAALLGDFQEIGADAHSSVADPDVDQDRAVGDAELRAVGIAVFGPELGIQVVEEQVESLEVFALAVALHALLEELLIDLALR